MDYVLLSINVNKDILIVDNTLSYHYTINKKFRTYVNSYVNKYKLKLHVNLYKNNIKDVSVLNSVNTLNLYICQHVTNVNILHSLYRLNIYKCNKIKDIGNLKYVKLNLDIDIYVYGTHLIKNLKYNATNNNITKIKRLCKKLNKQKNNKNSNNKNSNNNLLQIKQSISINIYYNIVYSIHVLLYIIITCFLIIYYIIYNIIYIIIKCINNIKLYIIQKYK